MIRYRTGAAALAIAVATAGGHAHAQSATANAAPQIETGAAGQGQTISQGATAQQTTSGAPADDASDSTKDIIVTAQKSGAQILQKVPLAIQAFSGEDLKRRNINSVDDLVSSVPGAFEGQRQSVASRSYNLRGAGGSNANGDSPIGYYLDDVPFVVTNFGIAPPVRFIDIDRIEVLRGPQGTLYGQGSSGGVFVFHTRDPNLEKIQAVFEGNLSQTKGADGVNYDVSAAVSVPIIKDVLGIRVSGGHAYNPGWADEYYGDYDGTPDRKGVNSIRNDDIRVVGLLKPADNVSIRAQYWHFRPRQQFLGSLQNVDPPYYADTAGQPSFGNGDFKLYSLSATVDFKSFSVTSATSDITGNFGIYVPIAPAGFFSSQFYPKMFSEEIRVNSTSSAPFHWLLGGAYEDGQGPQANQLTIPVAGLDTNADNNTITRNWAVFGQLSYDLFDGRLVPLVGLRYYHDKRTFEDSTTSNSSVRNVTTWRANLAYLPSDELTLFVNAATGFRAGIVQSQIQATLLQQVGVPASTQLNPERSTNYELGIKWRTPGRNLTVGLNGYLTTYTDLQTSTPTLNPSVSGFSNFGDAVTRGVDFEVHWRTPLKGVSLGAVGNVNGGHFYRVDPAVQAAISYLRPGTRLINSIERNWRIDAAYTGRVSDKLDGFANVAWSHSGNRLQTGTLADGSTGLIYANPYSLFSATVGVRQGPYELALVGENLANAYAPTIVFGTANAGVRPTPRTIGLRFRANFQ